MAVAVADLLRRWQDLKAQRSTYETVWQDIAEYTVPHRANIQRQQQPGEKKTDKIFDSTAVRALPMLAAHLHATLTPSTQPWLSFALRDERLSADQTVREWLEDCARRMHRAFRQSNFNVAVHEMYLDLVGPSATGCLYVEEKAPPASGIFGGFRFRAHSAEEYTIAEDANGMVDTVYRRLRFTARQLIQKWGEAKVGTRVVERHRQKPDEPYEVVHAVQPRTDLQYAADGARKRGPGNMPVASCYVLVEGEDGAGKRGRKLEEGGYEEFPYMVPRWLKAAGELYGFGPSHLALPDVRTMNAAKEFLLKAAPLAIFPPTIERDDAVIGEPDLTPAGRNVVGGTGALTDQLAFMQTGLKVDIGQIVFGDLIQSIRETYYIPQLELTDAPQMTATEVQVRFELMMRYLGAVLERLMAEFLNPLVERCFAIMARARAFAPMPDMLRDQFGDADLDVQYEGPLARAQRGIELVAQERVTGWVSAVAQSKTQFPDPLWDNLNLDKMLRDRVTITGLSADALNAEDEVDETRQARLDAANKREQAATMMEAAKAAGSFAPMVREMNANGGAMGGQPGGSQTSRAA